ncbi:MAG: hypothetical protein M5U19_04490 [Microthrixaceae bacterium]|nr:hypothetical protein [Microthrixaceae bacterium]
MSSEPPHSRRLRPALNAGTRVAAVIGDPVAHSRSPAILNAAFEATGIDWVFVGFVVRKGAAAQAVEAMRTLGIAGMSVTMPPQVRGDRGARLAVRHGLTPGSGQLHRMGG